MSSSKRTRKRPSKKQSAKSAWVEKVCDYLDRQILIHEGDQVAVQYLETCALALRVCDQLGIDLRNPLAATATRESRSNLRAFRPERQGLYRIAAKTQRFLRSFGALYHRLFTAFSVVNRWSVPGRCRQLPRHERM
jgi:hypothetical protein